MIQKLDDHSVNFDIELLNKNSESIKAKLKALHPNYFRVWMDLSLGYFVVISLFIFSFHNFKELNFLNILATTLTALILSFFIHYISLFFHEAAHFNLTKSKKLNDMFANILMGIPFAQDIKVYRAIHWDHHRFLGTTQDTEHSYFNALTKRFIFETLTGIHLFRVLLFRFISKNNQSKANAKEKNGKKILMITLAFMFHFSILIFAVKYENYLFAYTWIFSFFVFLPFFATIRQLLEHRKFDALKEVNYSEVPHGAYTRMFKPGPISYFLGGAGFDRHLIHHWLPHNSYTNFDEILKILDGTELDNIIRNQEFTYWFTFREIARKSN